MNENRYIAVFSQGTLCWFNYKHFRQIHESQEQGLCIIGEHMRSSQHNARFIHVLATRWYDYYFDKTQMFDRYSLLLSGCIPNCNENGFRMDENLLEKIFYIFSCSVHGNDKPGITFVIFRLDITVGLQPADQSTNLNLTT